MSTSIKLTLLTFAVSTAIACTSNSDRTSETDSMTASATTSTPVTVDTVGVDSQPTVSAAEEPEVVKVDKAPASEPTIKQATKEVLTPAEVSRGESLIQGSDCLACHTNEETLIGPSYKEVAAKYSKSTASIAYLAKKIKNGGSGVWGDVPMTPHPALSDSDARAMAQYVLSLK